MQWFNPAAFVAPQPWQYGNSARNSSYGPGFWNYDIGVQKTFGSPNRTAFKFAATVWMPSTISIWATRTRPSPIRAMAACPIRTPGKIFGGSGTAHHPGRAQIHLLTLVYVHPGVVLFALFAATAAAQQLPWYMQETAMTADGRLTFLRSRGGRAPRR